MFSVVLCFVLVFAPENLRLDNMSDENWSLITHALEKQRNNGVNIFQYTWWPSEQPRAREEDGDIEVGGRSEVGGGQQEPLSLVTLEVQHPFLSCTVTCHSIALLYLCYWWWWQKHIFLVFHLRSCLTSSPFAKQHVLGASWGQAPFLSCVGAAPAASRVRAWPTSGAFLWMAEWVC